MQRQRPPLGCRLTQAWLAQSSGFIVFAFWTFDAGFADSKICGTLCPGAVCRRCEPGFRPDLHLCSCSLLSNISPLDRPARCGQVTSQLSAGRAYCSLLCSRGCGPAASCPEAATACPGHTDLGSDSVSGEGFPGRVFLKGQFRKISGTCLHAFFCPWVIVPATAGHAATRESEEPKQRVAGRRTHGCSPGSVRGSH